jgi:hypothetical protein
VTSPAALDAALDFLQLAVIVDDRALDGPVAEAASELEVPEEFVAAEEDPEPATETADLDDTTSLRTRRLTDAFADLSIGCAVLAPEDTSAKTRTRVRGLAARADILVLDWVLHQPATEEAESGPGHDRTSLTLIEELLQADADSGGRLRLLCIYTGSSSIDGILNQIEEVLRTHAETNLAFGTFEVDRANRTIRAAHMSVLILLKPTNPLAGSLPTTSEAELPKVLVAAFAALAGGGLLPQLALAAVSAVRTHTHRLVARFPAELDTAFLSHRALTSPYAAEQYALELVGDELSALLSASRVDKAVHARAVKQRLGQLFPTGVTTRAVNPKLILSRAEALRLLGLGHDAATPVQKVGGGELSAKNITNNFATLGSLMFDQSVAGFDELALEREEDFGVLSCLSRSQQFEGRSLPPPVLTLGTVLRHRVPGRGPAAWRHWICLQPGCDSVRLPPGKDISFPLFPLDVRLRDERCDLLIQSPDSAAVTHLGIRINEKSGKRSMVDLESFNFRPGAHGVVQAKWFAGPRGWHFRSNGGPVFHWLGQLRTGQSQRLVGDLASAFSRAGLDESEYVRKHP